VRISQFPCVDAGSNTSIIALRVVRSDEKGTHCLGVHLGRLFFEGVGGYKYGDLASRLREWSLESETVKYGHEARGTRTREWLRWRGQQKLQTTDPPCRQRGRPTSTNPKLSDINKNLVLDPTWGITPREIVRLTVGCNITDFELVSGVE
jgi:hypothetical protein